MGRNGKKWGQEEMGSRAILRPRGILRHPQKDLNLPPLKFGSRPTRGTSY